MHYEPDDALCRIKSGIIAYNLAVGGENTGQNGYHETITILWWSLIHLFVERHREFSYEDLCDAFYHRLIVPGILDLNFTQKKDCFHLKPGLAILRRIFKK